MHLNYGPLSVDLLYGRILRDGDAEDLTLMETRLLAYLYEHGDRWVSQDELLTRVWGYAPRVRSRTVRTTVNRLRQKLETDPSHPRVLLTRVGEGYRLAAPTSPACRAIPGFCPGLSSSSAWPRAHTPGQATR